MKKQIQFNRWQRDLITHSWELLRWPWVSYSCSSWAWFAVIVTGGCRRRCPGYCWFFLRFWCVGVKSDSGRRDSNPGSERSQPKTLTTFFFFFFISVYLLQVIYIFFYIIIFQNKRWILVVGWYRQEYRYAAVRRSHALLHSFHFFFFLRLLLLNKIKLSRCCAVPMYDILIYVLKAWTQKQDSSLAHCAAVVPP